MKSSFGVLGVATVVATLLISITSARGQELSEEKAWVLQERTLPAPAAASEALRDSIAKAPQPDVARSQGVTFKTNEEWLKWIRAADEAAVAKAEALAERMKVTIKEEKIAGVTVRTVMPVNINPANENRLSYATRASVPGRR